MKIEIEIDEVELIKLVVDRIEELTGNKVDPALVRIETKSQRNYRAEWEKASFRARYVRVN